MDFRTELTPSSAPWGLTLGDQVITMGSCFAQSIGQRFLSNKFRTIVNPFGTTYHPLAIHSLLNYSIFQEYPIPNTYLSTQGITYNYNLHSSFSAESREALEHYIHKQVDTVHAALKACKVLLITYGTAWLYERIDTGEAVANCHRMPASQFTKRLTSAEEIAASFRKVFEGLARINPGIKIVLTLSPVRHVKDTLVLNSVSKSIVRLACHQIIEEHDQVTYFPAYELLMDDLRDYRFYKEDLIHPTAMAEDYIWQKFTETYFHASAKDFVNTWRIIQQSLAHRPSQPQTDAHQQFLVRALGQLEALQSVVNVDREIQDLRMSLLRQPKPS